MTGWDNPEDFDNAPADSPSPDLNPNSQGKARYLLVALAEYLSANLPQDLAEPAYLVRRNAVTDALNQIDWNAVEFTLDALAQGQIVFSGHRNQDVVTRYTST